MNTHNDKFTLESAWPVKILCNSEEKLLLLKNNFGNQSACFNAQPWSINVVRVLDECRFTCNYEFRMVQEYLRTKILPV